MKRLFSTLFQKIGFSILEGNKHSSSRIQSYIVLAPIILMALIFLGFEITAFAFCIYAGKTYIISSEIIIIYGMLLSHHLALVFSRKTSQSIGDIKGDQSNILKEKEENLN